MGRRVHLQERLEHLDRPIELPGHEVGPAEGLEDRAAPRLQPVGPSQHDGGLRVVAAREQGLAALQQLVGALGLPRGRGVPAAAGLVVHGPIVARIG